MDKHSLKPGDDEAALRRFTRHLLRDVRALEHMLEGQTFETGIRRVGAEQELFLVDERWQPAPVVDRVLEAVGDERFVTELMRFNVEFNLDPMVFEGGCLREMQRRLTEGIEMVRRVLRADGCDVAMVGILPTISLADLKLENMTPAPRYFALSEVISRFRGGPAQLQIQGIDELYTKHEGITVEGCNTSFQTHFQAHPDEFASLYNIAQVVAAPVLAAATNAPLLFGKRLWRETRIALFQQAIDTRSPDLYLREMSPRVHFGTGWIRESVLEIIQEDIARFRVLLTTGDVEDPFDVLEKGGAPQLQALQHYNGTIYRWNRACYGVTDGRPHLRIENRILPSGPTVVDQVANAAFWFGLVSALAREHPDVTRVMEFEDAKSNFGAAARLGLGSQLAWFGGQRVPAQELILEELLPLARDGLRASGIDADDVGRYLGVIEERVISRQTGSEWQLSSLAEMRGEGTRLERMAAIVAAMVHRQTDGKPVHTWPPARLEEGSLQQRMETALVEDFMSTDLITANEAELVEFVAQLMDWQRTRYVVVEDDANRLVGLVTHRNLLRFLARGTTDEGPGLAPVRDVMIRNPVAVSPETTVLEAIRIMREKKIGSLPVVRDGRLVGMITEQDMAKLAGRLFDENFKGTERTSGDGPAEA